jgi:hypothetical protein
MGRVTVRKRRSVWHVHIDGSQVDTCPTLQEAKAIARRTARKQPAPPPIEIREQHGGWRTVAP